MSLKRIAFAAVAVLILASSLLVIVGCKAAEARERADEWAVHLDKTLQQKDKVDQLILKLQAGQVIPEAAINEMIALLPLEWQNKVREAQTKGHEALKIAADVSTALGMTFESGRQELAKFKEAIAHAEADDDVTREVVIGVLSGIAGIFGVGGPVSIVANLFGKKTGATQVASVIAAGRAADPNLNEAFASGPGHDIMQGLVKKAPKLEAVITAANETVPYPKSDLAKMAGTATT